jgi:hypothetical protein
MNLHLDRALKTCLDASEKEFVDDLVMHPVP